jgi:hypothetical protein
VSPTHLIGALVRRRDSEIQVVWISMSSSNGARKVLAGVWLMVVILQAVETQ